MTEKQVIKTLTARDGQALLDTLIAALSALSEDISALRLDFADLRSELRSVREQNTRQDQEIWGSDGFSRLAAVQGDSQKHSLQIKGLWAILGGMIGFLITYVLTRS